jgi:hypothetical protein
MMEPEYSRSLVFFRLGRFEGDEISGEGSAATAALRV